MLKPKFFIGQDVYFTNMEKYSPLPVKITDISNGKITAQMIGGSHIIASFSSFKTQEEVYSKSSNK